MSANGTQPATAGNFTFTSAQLETYVTAQFNARLNVYNYDTAIYSAAFTFCCWVILAIVSVYLLIRFLCYVKPKKITKNVPNFIQYVFYFVLDGLIILSRLVTFLARIAIPTTVTPNYIAGLRLHFLWINIGYIFFFPKYMLVAGDWILMVLDGMQALLALDSNSSTKSSSTSSVAMTNTSQATPSTGVEMSESPNTPSQTPDSATALNQDANTNSKGTKKSTSSKYVNIGDMLAGVKQAIPYHVQKKMLKVMWVAALILKWTLFAALVILILVCTIYRALMTYGSIKVSDDQSLKVWTSILLAVILFQVVLCIIAYVSAVFYVEYLFKTIKKCQQNTSNAIELLEKTTERQKKIQSTLNTRMIIITVSILIKAGVFFLQNIPGGLPASSMGQVAQYAYLFFPEVPCTLYYMFMTDSMGQRFTRRKLL